MSAPIWDLDISVRIGERVKARGGTHVVWDTSSEALVTRLGSRELSAGRPPGKLASLRRLAAKIAEGSRVGSLPRPLAASTVTFVCQDLCMAHDAVRAAVRVAQLAVGRRRLAKLARLVTAEVRMDTENEITRNGEALVQRFAMAAAQPVIFDVGAHYGEWSASLLGLAGNALTLYAFEPSAHSAARARAVIGERGQVQVLGLSDTPGQGDLLIVHEGAGSNSVVPFTDSQRASGKTERITFTTVDDFCAHNRVEKIRLLKIDAEGHDLAVIRGARRMLATQAIDLIQFEYNHRWIDARVFLLDAFQLLKGQGYQVGKVTPSGVEIYEEWHPELEKFVEGNYLGFVPGRESGLPLISWWGPA